MQLLQAFLNPFQNPLPISQITFPDSNDAPARPPQGVIYNPVAGFVARQFLFPECGIIPRLGRVPGTSMPETAVHKDCRARFAENEVRAHGEGWLRVES